VGAGALKGGCRRSDAIHFVLEFVGIQTARDRQKVQGKAPSDLVGSRSESEIHFEGEEGEKEIKKMVEGVARLAADPKPAPTKSTKRASSKKVKSKASPTRMAETAGAKKSSLQRASKRKSTRK
jgi:hypothetical protein